MAPRLNPQFSASKNGGIHLLVATESPMDCQLLKNTLRGFRLGVSHVSSAVTLPQVLDAVRQDKIDLALISDHFDDGEHNGLQVVEYLFLSYPKIRSVLLVTSTNRDLILEAFRSGARGVFCRVQPIQTLAKCIRVVHQGQIWANSDYLEIILQALIRTKPRRVLSAVGDSVLTKREQEVAVLLADGLSNREIAKQLGLSQHTVNNYLFKSYEKLGISSRVEMVLYVLSQRQEHDYPHVIVRP
jgi:DNA-binding NarL/FixJ family response regulator